MRDLRKFWPFMTNFWGFGAIALVIPLLVVHYGDLGFSGTQIGILVGVPPIVTIFGATLWANLADRTGRHQRIWGALFFGAVVAALLLARVDTFVAVLAAVVLLNTALSPFPSFTDTSTIYMLGDEKDQYGRIRVGGTFGFALFAYVGGVLAERFGIVTGFYAGAVVLLVAWLAASRLRFEVVDRPRSGDRAGIGDLLRRAHWWVFVAVGFAGGIGFSLNAAFFYPLLEELGAVESTIGLAILIGTISEVPVLFFGHRFLAAMRPFTLLVATVVFTGLRFVGMAYAGSVGAIMAIQATHGLTFVLMWTAAVAFADAYAPVGRETTAQGIFAAACTGAGAAAGGLVGGPILTGLGAERLFLVGGIAITAIAVVAGLLGRRVVAAARV